MSGPSIWKEEFRIKSYEVDMKGKATLTALCNYFQDAAGNHADALEGGMSFLLERNQIWVLSRMLVRMEILPRWNEKILVETWSKGADGLFALRDFLVLDAKGKTLGKATTGWLIIDLNTRRPQRLDTFIKQWPFTKEREGLDEKLERLALCKPEKESLPFRVRVSDLDINNHVNNVKYAEWIMDDFGMEMRTKYDIASFEINYQAEAFYNDEVFIRSERIPEEQPVFLNAVIRKSDNKEICRVRTGWKSRGDGA
ncbi:MAG: thioesterase [bacterium]|nr:thioesterase [bacterium]